MSVISIPNLWLPRPQKLWTPRTHAQSLADRAKRFRARFLDLLAGGRAVGMHGRTVDSTGQITTDTTDATCPCGSGSGFCCGCPTSIVGKTLTLTIADVEWRTDCGHNFFGSSGQYSASAVRTPSINGTWTFTIPEACGWFSDPPLSGHTFGDPGYHFCFNGTCTDGSFYFDAYTFDLIFGCGLVDSVMSWSMGINAIAHHNTEPADEAHSFFDSVAFASATPIPVDGTSCGEGSFTNVLTSSDFDAFGSFNLFFNGTVDYTIT